MGRVGWCTRPPIGCWRLNRGEEVGSRWGYFERLIERCFSKMFCQAGVDISGELYTPAALGLLQCTSWHNPHLFSPGGSDVWIKREPSTPLFSSPPGRTCLYGTEQHRIMICYIWYLNVNWPTSQIMLDIGQHPTQIAFLGNSLRLSFTLANAFCNVIYMCPLHCSMFIYKLLCGKYQM